jgi:acetaldehyde dehydrogenase (acetylating)
MHAFTCTECSVPGAHYLPAYAGNLDIVTSTAVRVAEQIAELAGAELAVAGQAGEK